MVQRKSLYMEQYLLSVQQGVELEKLQPQATKLGSTTAWAMVAKLVQESFVL